jgi:CubicO group peptidase (beta-lactamase class C family)
MQSDTAKLTRRRFLTLITAAAASTALAACSSGKASPTAIPTAPIAPSQTPGAPTATLSVATPTTAPTVATTVATTTSASPIAGTPTVTSGATMPNTLMPDASPRFRAVAERVMALLAEQQVPGASLGILADGTEEYASFGVASIETKTPVALDTLFQIGSLTKTYTGTAIMRLVEQEKVNLDAPVRTYLPDLKLADASVAAAVTIKHLLTHTGGWWGDSFTDTGNGDDAIARFVTDKLPTFPQIEPLGAFFSYNNSGFVLLGRVIEAVTGKPYRAALADLVLQPLGIAAYFSPDEVMAHPYAVGHGEGKNGLQVAHPLYLPRNIDPAGGIFATAREQIRYARFHLGDGTTGGTRVLKAETLQLMQSAQPVTIPGQTTVKIGLPWFVQQVPGHRLIAHPGDTLGQHTEFVAVPDKGFAFVLLTNATKGAIVASSALNAAIGQYLGVGPVASTPGATVAAPPTAAIPPTVALPPEKLAEYVGRYALPTGTIILHLENGALTVQSEPGDTHDQIMPDIKQQDVPANARLAFVKEDLALVGNTPATSVPVTFVRKPDGSVGWLDVNLRLIPKQG